MYLNRNDDCLTTQVIFNSLDWIKPFGFILSQCTLFKAKAMIFTFNQQETFITCTKRYNCMVDFLDNVWGGNIESLQMLK